MFQRWTADLKTGGRASVSWFCADLGEGASEIIDNLNRVEVAA